MEEDNLLAPIGGADLKTHEPKATLVIGVWIRLIELANETLF